MRSHGANLHGFNEATQKWILMVLSTDVDDAAKD